METAIVYWGSIADNGKENGNYYMVPGFIGVQGLGMRVQGLKFRVYRVFGLIRV